MRYKTVTLLLYLLFSLMDSPLSADNPTVTYWHVGTYDEVVMLQQLADQFYEQTGIQVQIQPIPWGNFQTKYLTAMASGEPPDAGSTNLSGPIDYGKVGGVIDLEESYPLAVARLKKNIFPSVWNTCYFRGHLFGVPHDATALIGFYRKDIFDSLGLSPPSTWSELETVLDTLMVNNYQYGFMWTRNTHWGMGSFVWPYNEYLYADKGRRVNWDALNFRKGYTYAIQLWNRYNMATEKPIELFSIPDKKKALPLFFDFQMRYSEILIRAPHIKDQFGFFPFPHPDEGLPATMMGGRTVVIFRDGKHPDEAMQWIEFLLSVEAQVFKFHFMANLGERSTLDLSVNQEFWRKDLALPPGHQASFYDVYRRLRTEPTYPWVKESDRILEQSFYKIRDILQRHLRQTAQAYDMSRHDLLQAFAAGNLIEEKNKFESRIVSTCEDILNDLGPTAQSKLDQDYVDYEHFYGKHIDQFNESQAGWDILDYAELLIAILVVIGAMFLIISPHLRRNWISYIYIAPPIVAAMVFIFIPMLVSLYLSFTKYNPVMPLSQAVWVGIENYKSIISGSILWQSMGRSLYFALIVLPIQLFIGVILAAFLDKDLFPDRLHKFLYFSPLVTSIVSVSLIWFALYVGTSYGWINGLLLKLNLIRDPIMFLKDKRIFLNAVIVMSIWQGLAFTILIFLAGLQNVPNELHEAASIDGAGSLRQFMFISLPTLKPQVTFLVVMGTIGAIQVFEQIYMLGGGAGEAESKFGPDDSGMTIVPFLYRKGFEYFKMGEASAIAYILFSVLFILTYLNLKIFLKEER